MSILVIQEVHHPRMDAMTADERFMLDILPGEIEAAGMRIDARQYVGAAVDPSNGGLIVYWYGDVPEEIAELIAGVGDWVDVRPVPFPTDVLHFHARRLAGEPQVVSAGSGSDFQSLSLTVLTGTPPVEVERLCRTIPAPLDPATAARFPHVDGIRVTVGRFGGPLVRL